MGELKRNLKQELSPFLEPAEPELEIPSPEPDEPPGGSSESGNRDCWVILCAAGLLVIMDLPLTIAGASRTRLYEAIYCAAWFKSNDPSYIGNNGSVEERYCKIDPVQTGVSSLKGWMGFFGNVPGVLLGIPFGILADRRGRKWLLVVNVVSLWARDVWIYAVCAFPNVLPIRLLWLEAFGAIFGGGYTVARALVYAVISDVTLPATRANVFIRVNAASYLCFLIGPVIGALLLEQNVWIPMNITLGIHGITALIALMLPETLHRKTESKSEVFEVETTTSVYAVIIVRYFTLGSRWLRSNFRFLTKDWRINLILTLYVVYININTLLYTILLQYISKRYSLTLAHASFFWSFEAVVNIVLLVLVLPALSTYLEQTRGHSILTRDILLVRLSYLILAIGLLMIGLAPDLPIMTIGLLVANFGTGGNVLMRLLLTYFVHPDHLVKMHSVISVLKTVSSAIAEPLVAALFNIGLSKGGYVWQGLPFLVFSALFAIAALVLWVAPMTSAKMEKDGEINDYRIYMIFDEE